MTPRRFVVVLVLGLAALAAVPASDLDSSVRAVLARDLRFSPSEFADLQRGRTVKHTIDTNAPGEVAVAGGVRVNAPKSALLDGLRDIVHFKRNADVLQIGRFSNPPVIADLDALTVDADDFDAKNCRVGDCSVRLPADVIRRLQQEIDPKAPDAQEAGGRFFKKILFDDIAAYLAGSRDRMAQYDDGDRPIRPVDEFDAMLKNTPALGALVPGLPAYLAAFPTNRLEGAEDFLYWSKEKFGIAPFITVTHVTIVCESVHTCVATSKDVYSSRYFDTSLALTIATDSQSNPDTFYLVYANRSRANALKGGFGGLWRSIVGRRARGSLDDSLRSIKNLLEKGK
ncbi:MAG: hypothetical protein ACHQO8_12690 [Vicinamibacterales bacterium]